MTDNLNFLKDKQMIKVNSYGNAAKGTVATQSINSYALELIRRWLLIPTPALNSSGDKEINIPNLYHIQSRALLQELIAFNSEGNFDRVSSLGMLMLLREDRITTNKGNFNSSSSTSVEADYLGNDPFFNNNYEKRFSKNQW